MKDMANNDVYPGDFVKIIFSDYKNQEGKIVRVIRSDNPEKIKVEFDESWVGYFYPHQVVKYYVSDKKSKNEKILDDHALILEILKNPDHPSYQNVIKLIRKKYISLDKIFNYLNCEIAICDDFTAKEWFKFGIIFSKQIG
jgi:hypothetical protein